MLKETFTRLVLKYNTDPLIARELWEEIVLKYSEKERHYHNLGHLGNMIIELNEVKDFIKDWDASLLATFYHDIIYFSNDNEVESASLAKKSLKSIDVPFEIISKCNEMILASKSHQKSEDQDINYFIDADLSILGYMEKDYETYIESVRKEYCSLSDMQFKNGRNNIVKRFLDKDKIYSTAHFYKKYETQARKNLKRELEN